MKYSKHPVYLVFILHDQISEVFIDPPGQDMNELITMHLPVCLSSLNDPTIHVSILVDIKINLSLEVYYLIYYDSFLIYYQNNHGVK